MGVMMTYPLTPARLARESVAGRPSLPHALPKKHGGQAIPLPPTHWVERRLSWGHFKFGKKGAFLLWLDTDQPSDSADGKLVLY